MKVAPLILIVLHGIIHLAGFVKAFNFATINQLSQNVSKINGVLWLLTAILFLSTALIFSLNKENWWIIAALAIVLSQYLVFTSWHDAKFGTIANVILLVAIIIECWICEIFS